MSGTERVVVRPTSPWASLWAMRSWAVVSAVAGGAVATIDLRDGALVWLAGTIVFGGCDALWTWVRLGSSFIEVDADAATFHERFRRSRRVPLGTRREFELKRSMGVLSWISPANADFASVLVLGSYEEMTFLAFTDRQVRDLEARLARALELVTPDLPRATG